MDAKKTMTRRLSNFALDENNLSTGDTTMDGSIVRTREYKGCGIHAASYKVGPDWVPEACFWVHTKNGWTRMWINSFAHFFEIPELTFSSETEADDCAFRLARRLIDKTLPDLNSSISRRRGTRSTYLSKILQIARQSFSAYAHRKERKNLG
jgi:hypothetical protein